jgi:hypothetical protein
MNQPNPPCKDCICFAICNSRVKDKYPIYPKLTYPNSHLNVLTLLYWKCDLLYLYLLKTSNVKSRLAIIKIFYPSKGLLHENAM